MSTSDILERPGANATTSARLPANIEAEAAFLGAVLIDNRVIEELQAPLRPDHFFEPLHERIYERILKLLERNATASPVTLKPYFEADEALRELGGTTYLAGLTQDGLGLLAAGELAQQIYDLALLRELVSVGRGLVEGALDTSDDVAPMERVAEAEAQLYKVTEGAATGNEASSFRKAAMEAIKMAEAAMNSGGGLSGKTTGLEVIGQIIGTPPLIDLPFSKRALVESHRTSSVVDLGRHQDT